jgi:predicted MFS family arabinose efflux permease
MFTMPINMGLLPVFAKDMLKAGPEGLGLLMTAMGVGAILGTLTIASLGNFAYKGPLLLIGAVFLGSAMVAYSQVTTMSLAIPLLGIVAFCFTTYSTLNQTILQTVTPDEFRGRVTSLHLMDQGLVPLGSLIAGTVAEFFGVSVTILIFGFATMFFVLLIGGRFKAIRGFRSGT